MNAKSAGVSERGRNKVEVSKKKTRMQGSKEKVRCEYIKVDISKCRGQKQKTLWGGTKIEASDKHIDQFDS